ncbi:hypothetical protein CPAR01_07969 [Colletotrichum paranaense]|uniref:Uncharacterized protein n=1 Tax=Colletotrichum paranaense TaxID=1914294 RepID=A0ABQ9SIX2_9PEZI|nr:uncharacterized protein CPAR01_07969 [Colletotrichum paranaense]KAK1537856.1 hypothetical protein CPAR01_07969 [Colletotrichum paranaense]
MRIEFPIEMCLPHIIGTPYQQWVTFELHIVSDSPVEWQMTGTGENLETTAAHPYGILDHNELGDPHWVEPTIARHRDPFGAFPLRYCLSIRTPHPWPEWWPSSETPRRSRIVRLSAASQRTDATNRLNRLARSREQTVADHTRCRPNRHVMPAYVYARGGA